MAEFCKKCQKKLFGRAVDQLEEGEICEGCGQSQDLKNTRAKISNFVPSAEDFRQAANKLSKYFSNPCNRCERK